MHSPCEQVGDNQDKRKELAAQSRTKKRMAEFLKIHLDIAGKKYQFQIDRAKEEVYRKAEKEINRLVATIESKYRIDKEGCLAMAALQLALQNVEHATARNIDDDLAELTKIERTLDAYLSKLE